MARRTRTLVEEDGATLQLASPEDTVAHKLYWYGRGGGVSDRQWNDVLGVLKERRGSLDERLLTGVGRAAGGCA